MYFCPVLTINELLYFGLATHYYELTEFENIKDKFINYGEIFSKKYEISNDSFIIKNINLINDIFNGNIHEVIKNLKEDGSEFSNKNLEILLKKCPMSLAITTKLIENAKGKSLKECLEIEFQLSQKIVYRDDFDNGVNSVLVSKDHKPKWSPANIDEININDLDKYFETHTETLYL